jgi:hypothetical protein
LRSLVNQKTNSTQKGVAMKSLLKLPTLVALSVAAVIGLSSSLALAASDATQTIAGIVKDLNHFPSDDQKQTLSKIAEDDENSEAVQTIASAVRDMQHTVQAEDRAELEEIASNADATEAEQKLATIVMNINHKPGPEAVAQLEQIANGDHSH